MVPFWIGNAVAFVADLEVEEVIIFEQHHRLDNLVQPYSVDYIADEDAARWTRINIWSGDFDMPWEWRAQRRNR